MSISSFLKLVEIQTKVASMIPFTLGSLYALHRFNRFNVKNFIFMLISLLCFDMATTAINNYFDFKKAQKTKGYNYEVHNAIVKDGLSENTVVAIIVTLVTIAITLGFLLFLNTNYVVLFIGIASFFTGVIYSFGPIPISRMPLGEIFSGFFMGVIIPFLAMYIHVWDSDLFSFAYSNNILSLTMNVKELIFIFIFSIPTMNGIANIMLANNTCDMEDDIENRRYTLPIYIGKKNALKLFKMLYYIAYLGIIIAIILGILPITSLITLLTIIPVNKNLKIFFKKQTKKDTFIVAVKNFIIINVVQILSLIVALMV